MGEPPKIVPEEQVASLRAQAAELRVLAGAARNPLVARMLIVEAGDREDQANALEQWLRGRDEKR